MSEYDRIDVSEGIYINKKNISKTVIFVITDIFQTKVQRKIERASDKYRKLFSK